MSRLTGEGLEGLPVPNAWKSLPGFATGVSGNLASRSTLFLMIVHN
jgi:hypothetical protein